MSASSIAAEIEKAITAIWGAPPADLDGMTTAHRPPSRDMVKRLYANFDRYWTAGFLYFASQHVRAEPDGWAHSRRLLGAIAAACARRLDLWNCRSAASVLRKAVTAIDTVENVSEGLDVVQAIVLYLNCLQSWVDATIPWSALDDVPPRDVRELRA